MNQPGFARSPGIEPLALRRPEYGRRARTGPGHALPRATQTELIGGIKALPD